MRWRCLVLLAVTGLGAPAVADDVIPGHRVDGPTDGTITAVAVGGTLGLSLIPIRVEAPLWRRELFAADEAVRDNFSRRASHVSDALLVASLAAPAIYLTGRTIDDADGDRLILYGQTVAINGLLAQAGKHLVQRPRPYMYGKSSAARAYAAEAGADGRKSFYSGHAAMSFGAAVTGAYFLGASDAPGVARGFAWGAGLAVAATTATLRVRAGKHYYSDVVIGAVVGMTVGYLVPALHAEGDPYVPSGQELAAGAAGVLGGMLLGQLLPLERRSESPVKPSALARLRLAPTPVEAGFGFALAGSL